MTILSIVCTKLLCTNAHLGRRVADHHFKVYICGSRNGIAILDSDKTLICLRNALHFIGSLIRQKGRFFFLKTNHLFRYEIMEEMVSCINDSQWKIGAFLTNSFANKKKFRSRKKKINFGLNQQPDCVVILNADRKSSVILEADRSQIPIVSLVDSTIPWESYKRITYPIPANDSIQFVYLFCHLISIMKTVILERKRIPAIQVETPTRALRHFTLSTGSAGMKAAYHSTSSTQGKKVSLVRLNPLRKVHSAITELLMAVQPFLTNAAESVPQLQGGAAQVVQETPAPQGWAAQVVQETPAPQELTDPLPIRIVPSESQLMADLGDYLRNPSNFENMWNFDYMHNPILYSSEGAGPSTSYPPMDLSPTMYVSPTMNGPLSKDKIWFNLVYFSHKTHPDELTRLTEEIYSLKESILAELMRLAGPSNCDILWNTDGAGDAIRNRQGGEYKPNILKKILKSLQDNQELSQNQFLKTIWKERIRSIPKENFKFLRVEDLPGGVLDSLTQIHLGSDWDKLDSIHQKNLWTGKE
jgi:ribosomal protein S2